MPTLYFWHEKRPGIWSNPIYTTLLMISEWNAQSETMQLEVIIVSLTHFAVKWQT